MTESLVLVVALFVVVTLALTVPFAFWFIEGQPDNAERKVN